MRSPHLNLDRFVGIGIGAVAGCLLNKLAPMNEDKGLRSIVGSSLDSVNQLSEDDLPII